MPWKAYGAQGRNRRQLPAKPSWSRRIGGAELRVLIDVSDRSPLSGANRKTTDHFETADFDPKATFGTTVLDTSIRTEQHGTALFGE
jgi:hypothetical protein